MGADPAQLDIVTGAFGYSGQYITRRLLDRGRRVRTLTNHPNRPDPFHGRIELAPLAFDHSAELAAHLAGAHTLYNTYWVRFNHGTTTYERAVANTQALVQAAQQAGIRRIVHVSITNPQRGAALGLPYFRGKAALEIFIAARADAGGFSYAFIRPTVLYGGAPGEDILVNNIAWLLRRVPVFAIPGRGDYRVQPVHVDDLAAIAVDAGARTGNLAIDAVGPESFTFDELVRTIAAAIGRRGRILHVPSLATLAVGWAFGRFLNDVLITRAELRGLMANLLISDHPPTAPTRLSDWLKTAGPHIGRDYASEVGRHYR